MWRRSIALDPFQPVYLLSILLTFQSPVPLGRVVWDKHETVLIAVRLCGSSQYCICTLKLFMAQVPQRLMKIWGDIFTSFGPYDNDPLILFNTLRILNDSKRSLHRVMLLHMPLRCSDWATWSESMNSMSLFSLFKVHLCSFLHVSLQLTFILNSATEIIF